MLAKMLGRGALVCAAMVFAMLGLAAEEVVLKARDFVVTTQDFENYLTEKGVTDKNREQTLSREGMVKKVFEDIYVMRALAAEGARNPAINQAEIDWMVRSYRERLLMNKQLDAVVEVELRSVDFAALAAEEYKANKAKYTRPEEVSAAHILISLEGRTQEEALVRATAILARLEAGEDFGALASEHSDDPGSKQSAGELGFFARGRMVKPFEDAAFAMTKPGELSSPVKTDFGYHLIRYKEHRPEKQFSFEEVEARIIPEVKKRTMDSLRQDKLQETRSGTVDTGLEVNVPLLEEIIQRYSKPVETGPAKQ